MNQIKRLISMILITVILISAAGCAKGGGETTAPAVTEPLTDEQILEARREKVVEYMRNMTSILWRSDADVHYYKAGDGKHGALAVTYYAGRLYQGMPYTPGSSSAAALLTYAVSQDKNGVYQLSGLTDEDVSRRYVDGNMYLPCIGNDCADAVFWSWAQISSTAKFRGTINMTESNGCIAVGDYERTHRDSKGNTLDDTVKICETNGKNVMFASYAKLHPADAVVRNTTDGHAMLVSDVVVVLRDDGTINPTRSHIKIIDQTSGRLTKDDHAFNETLQEDVYFCGNIDKVYTFNELFSSGYLPVTCKELIDAAPLAEETVSDSEEKAGFDNIFVGKFTSPYRISHVTVTITDKDGKEVQKAICYGREASMREFDLSRFADPTEQAILLGSLDLNALPAGTYHCTHTCEIATGNAITVRSFDFTK